MIREYEGYLQPHLGLMRHLHSHGHSTGAIARYLGEEGVRSPYGEWPSTSLVYFALGLKRNLPDEIRRRRERIASLQAQIDTLEDEIDALIHKGVKNERQSAD